MFDLTPSFISVREPGLIRALALTFVLFLSGSATAAATSSSGPGADTIDGARLPLSETPASHAPMARGQCEDFAERQIGLAGRQLRRDNYSAALRVLNTAARNCDIPVVRNEIADVLDAWYRSIQQRGAIGEIPGFIEIVNAQSYLPDGTKSTLEARVASDVGEDLAEAFDADEFRRAHRLCRDFSDFVGGSFTQRFQCGESARQVRAYNTSIQRYEWLLDNWSSSQELVSWTDAARRLSELYLITTRFDAAFGLSKRLASRDTKPEYLLAALIADRGQYLVPIVRIGNTLFDGVTSDRTISHVKVNLGRVRFPSYVESIYTVTNDLGADIAFYGSDDARLPSASLVNTASGTVSLLTDSDNGRAWLITSVDAGYFIIQYSQKTVAEENVILESLLDDVQDESSWSALRDFEFTSTYPATGSAVATLLGGAYVSGSTISDFDPVFQQTNVLEYYSLQDEDGAIVASQDYARSQIDYTSDVWAKTSETPALYHHEVNKNGTRLREVVWPTYDDEQWSGVVRVGISSTN